MTDTKPQWVQVEKTPNLDDTGYMHFNLADVQYVGVNRPTNRAKGDNEPLEAEVKFVWGIVHLQGEQAQNFLNRWEAYRVIPEELRDEPAQPTSDLVAVRKPANRQIIQPVQHN